MEASTKKHILRCIYEEEKNSSFLDLQDTLLACVAHEGLPSGTTPRYLAVDSEGMCSLFLRRDWDYFGSTLQIITKRRTVTFVCV